ncbi:MAG: hypothetical protein KOO63_12445 [Bacteroidales bacterium]|nr:hypothetical protein [Candidatus Latescibacterota bacterium]
MMFQCYKCGELEEMQKDGPFLAKASCFGDVPEEFGEDAMFAVCTSCAKELGVAVAIEAAKQFPGLSLGVLGAAIIKPEEETDE